MTKTIIAVWNHANKGKSMTVRKVADIIMSSSSAQVLADIKYSTLKKDFRLIVRYHDKIIAFESLGDPSTALDERLVDIVTNYDPDLIICTSRTRGDTVSAITVLKNTYEIIWTSTYQYENAEYLEDSLNEIKAKHIFDLLKQLGRV